jgi:phosphoribosylanthranilate isomerase
MTHHHTIPLPLIKVCGLTREQDVPPLAAAGVTTIGLNFVPHSPRCIGHDLAQRLLARATECGLSSVAVVMNPSVDELSRLLSELSFDYLQLHGIEAPLMLEQIDWSSVHRPRGIIKAISWSGREEERLLAEAWRTHPSSANHPPLVAFLVDAYAPEQGGGTGRVARWDLLTPRPSVLSGLPLILAGGIVPDNVGAAIAAVSPDGIDTASGVEVSPGIKSEELVGRLGRAAGDAFQRVAAKRC